MASQLMNAEEVLEVGQGIRIHSADRKFQVEGKIFGLSLDYMDVELQITTQEYLNSPADGQTLFASASGGDCVFRFLTQFQSSSPLPEKHWYLDMPEKVQRQQKRQFVRVPILGNLPLTVKFKTAFGGRRVANDVTLFDLSGNGLCIVTDEEIPQGEKIQVKIDDLPGFGTLDSTAIVKRCTKVRILEHYIYHIGAFMEDSMTEGQRDRLVQSLFRLQQIYLKKGVGV